MKVMEGEFWIVKDLLFVTCVWMLRLDRWKLFMM